MSKLSEMTKLFPAGDGFTVEVVGTGGGCDWLTVTAAGDGGIYYAATNGDGNVPDAGEGFRYLGRYSNDDEHDDFEGTDLPLPISEDTSATSAAVAKAIRADIERRRTS